MRMLINKDKIISITYHKKAIDHRFEFHKEGDKVWAGGRILPISLKSDCFTCTGKDILFTEKELNEWDRIREGEIVYCKPYIDIYYNCTSICNEHEYVYFDSEDEMFNFNLESKIKGFICI